MTEKEPARRRRSRPWTAKDARDCLARRKAGASVKTLARLFERDIKSVYKRLATDGHPVRPPGPKPEPIRWESVADYAERIGMSRRGALRHYALHRKAPGLVPSDLAASARFRYRSEAEAMGWPECDSPAEARLMTLLYASGAWVRPAATHAETGMNRRRIRKTIARLLSRGLVEERGNAKAREYRIAPALLARRESA